MRMRNALFILTVLLFDNASARNLRERLADSQITAAQAPHYRHLGGRSSSKPADPDTTYVEGTHKIRYKYTPEGCVLEGYASSVDIQLNWCDSSCGPIDLHVSCSDDYVNGFSTKGNGPRPNQHPPIEKYFIQKLNKDCSLKANCEKSTDLDCGEKAANCTSNDDHGDCSKDSF